MSSAYRPPRSPASPRTTVKARRQPLTVGQVVLYVFVTCVLAGCSRWSGRCSTLLPRLRHLGHGYVSLGGFTFQNYLNAWEQGDFTRHFLNS